MRAMPPILGTLPVAAAAVLVRAKLIALLLNAYALGSCSGLSIIPAVVHPALSAARLAIQVGDGLRPDGPRTHRG